jgi:hypothetical protein
MADINTGMEKPDMKRLLMKSKQEPVNCAIGQGGDATIALLLLDKVKGPKSVEKDLAKQFPDAKNTRFGSAHVDMELDPKEVRFRVNKAAPGIARKLVKTLKGTGFTKAVIVLDDDGSVLEQAGEEDEAPQPAPPAAGTQAAPPAPPPPPPAPPPPQPNAADLTRLLTEQVKRIPGVLATAPALKDQFAKLATTAQAALKAGSLAEAASGVAALRQALDGAGNGAAPQPTSGGSQVNYIKSRLAWLAARKKIESDIEKLRSEIVATFTEDGTGPELDKLYRDRVAPVLTTLDESLADKLDEAMNAADPEQHRKLVGEARTIIDRYTAYVNGEALLADLDDNPFLPLTIKPTLTATLATLHKTIV